MSKTENETELERESILKCVEELQRERPPKEDKKAVAAWEKKILPKALPDIFTGLVNRSRH